MPHRIKTIDDKWTGEGLPFDNAPLNRYLSSFPDSIAPVTYGWCFSVFYATTQNYEGRIDVV